MSDNASAIRADAERGAAMLMRQGSKAGDAAFLAIGEGILTGVMVALMNRLGAERAYLAFQSKADELDRALLDARPPRKPDVKAV